VLKLLKLSRADNAFISGHGMRKAFHIGGNSSCRQHIRQHYEVYKTRCDAERITIHHWAIPRPVWKEMQMAKNERKAGRSQQGTLSDVFPKINAPKDFTREGVLHAVSKFIVCDDQVISSCPEFWASAFSNY
jgi:hypothetical protein